MGRVAVGAGGFVAAVAVFYVWISDAPAPPPSAPKPNPIVMSPVFSPAAAPDAPVVSADGLVLYGVSGADRSGAAILGSRLGGQRVVTVGKDYRPGLTLAEVGLDYAVLRNGPRDIRLELSRYAASGSAKVTAALPAEEEQKIEAAVLRTILTPVMANSRIGGYALKPGESLPQLIRAGLQPGDVILSVNGSQLDEERMSELAWQMGNASKTEFIFTRNGKKMRATI